MGGKRILMVLFIIFSTVMLYSFNIVEIAGVWLPQSNLTYILDSTMNRMMIERDVLEDRFLFRLADNLTNGILYLGSEERIIKNIQMVSADEVEIIFAGVDGNDNRIVFQFVSHDLIRVVSSPFNGLSDEYLCRICDSSKKAICEVKINNENVRFRTEPSLSGGVLFLLRKDEKLEILGRSAEKQEADDLKGYWYNVRIAESQSLVRGGGFLFDGWVFGAYIDFENEDKLDRYFKEEENSW
jgi:hypothetical protein